jgi:tetratricopeptide (TPR) repeat protein
MINDRRRLGQVWSYRVIQCLIRREHEEALRYSRLAVEVAAALGDLSVAAPANTYLGLVLWLQGDHEEACRVLERNVALLVGDLARERFGQATIPAVLSRGLLAVCLADLGRFEEAMAQGEEAVRTAESTGQVYSRGHALMLLGWMHERRGDLSRAVTILERAQEFVGAGQVSRGISGGVHSALAAAYARIGHVRAALELVDDAQVRAVPSQARDWIYAQRTAVCAGTASLLAGRLEWAREHAEETLRDGELGARAYHADALHLLGEIAAAEDPPDTHRAESRYREALALAANRGFRPLIAHCHLGLSRLYRRTGRHQPAEEHLTTAATMYREMKMPYWLEKVK